MQIRKLSCPSCDVTLRVAATIPAGKRIKCPKCAEVFTVPDDEDDEAPAPVAERPRRPARPRDEDEDEERDEEREERPPPRKRRKKKKKQTASNLPLILGLSVFGVLILSAGVLLAVFRPWEGKTDQATASNSATPGAPAPRPDRRERDIDPRSFGKGAAGQPPAESNSAGGGSDLASAGKQVYDSMDCKRCHVISGGGRSKGPNLARVGSKHNAEWLASFIANPQSQRPRSRGMPSYGEKLGRDELRSLAEYLASLR
jgi:mono/diheme cytochrome c family protein